MSTTREAIVTAAVTLVGERGTTALTHRRVDSRAGLPLGSTSNYFRTKASLLQAAIDGVLMFERPLVGNLDEIVSEAQFVEAIAAFVTAATSGPVEVVTAARLALFLEARHDAPLRERIAHGRRAHVNRLKTILQRLGASDPERGALVVVTIIEGAVFDRVTCVPDEDLTSVIAAAVAGALAVQPEVEQK